MVGLNGVNGKNGEGGLLSAVDMHVAFRDADRIRLITSQVCFGLGQKERISLIGESGTGKTVTALALCGLLEAHPGLIRGQVFLKGRDLYANLSAICREESKDGHLRIRKSRSQFESMLRKQVRPAAQSAIGLIFQEARETLDPLRTVRDQLVEAVQQAAGPNSATDPVAESTQLLQRLGFEQVRSVLASYPHELSGGMAQRIGIALALASKPSILLADEPTSALDSVLQKQVADLILDLQQREGWALLLITHNLRLAEYMTERILVMYGGMIVEILPAELLSDPTARLHPYTEELRVAVANLYGRRLSLAPPSTAGASSQTTTVIRLRRRKELGGTPCPFAARCIRKRELPADLRDRCEREMPEYQTVAGEGEHLVRCWLY